MQRQLKLGSVQVLLVLALLGFEGVLGQNRRVRPNTQRVPDTRLGLLATDFGLPPVPGGNPFTPGGGGSLGNEFFGNFGAGGGPGNRPVGGGNPGGVGNLEGPLGGREDRCFCVPANQPCPPEALVNFDLRIINVPGAERCPGRRECCFSRGPSTGGVNLNPSSVIPLGTCGRQNPLQVRQPQPPLASFGEYPWMSLVLDQANNFLGAGALISSEWVVTAAHKVHDKSPRTLKIRLGDYDASQVNEIPSIPHFESPVSTLIVHPNFDRSTLANDVALLRLQRPLRQPLPHVGPVCLPAQGQLFDGQRCTVTGWGQDSFQGGSFSPILKEVELPVIDHFRCQNLLRNTRLGSNFKLDTVSFLCAGGERDRDACTGDGGAPLVCRDRNTGQYTLAGLVAWGVGCAQDNVPGAYVNIPTYIQFIRQYVR